jgi:hypothetical protein
MISLLRGVGRLPSRAFALSLGLWAFSGVSAMAYDGHGSSPGFYGFGLSYHLGYGYGGSGVGAGPSGGYPVYGGPGYPHGEPRLHRFGKITPFPYYGGPSYTCYGQPTNFEGIGPLVLDRPVVEVGDGGDLGPVGGFGPYTGARPYPETFFAPYATAAPAAGISGGARSSDRSTTTAPDSP